MDREPVPGRELLPNITFFLTPERILSEVNIYQTFALPSSCELSSSTLKFQTSTHFFLAQFSSVSQLCPTLCDPMDCSMPDLPIHRQLTELAQTHIHRVGDAIRSSHPLSSPSLLAFNLSQHQELF